jgi:hypothetical protein
VDQLNYDSHDLCTAFDVVLDAMWKVPGHSEHMYLTLVHLAERIVEAKISDPVRGVSWEYVQEMLPVGEHEHGNTYMDLAKVFITYADPMKLQADAGVRFLDDN